MAECGWGRLAFGEKLKFAMNAIMDSCKITGVGVGA